VPRLKPAPSLLFVNRGIAAVTLGKVIGIGDSLVSPRVFGVAAQPLPQFGTLAVRNPAC